MPICYDGSDSVYVEITARTAEIVDPARGSDVQEFAKELCGLEGLNLEQMMDRCRNLKVPGDFRHFHLTNLWNGADLGGQIDSLMRPLQVNDILSAVCFACTLDTATPDGPGFWCKTVALPVRHAGTLELGLGFTPMTPEQLEAFEFDW